MSSHDAIAMEMEEPFTIRVEKSTTSKRDTIVSWCRRLVTLDNVPNQKHHRPIFIIVMSMLHIVIHLLTYIHADSEDLSFAATLFDLCKFFVPCMRPAPSNTRNSIVGCLPSMKGPVCRYDDVLKHMCFSFTYPHQLWRLFTVNVLHIDRLHLISNLLAQIIQGIPLERKFGSVRIAAVYWLSDLGASLYFNINHKEPAIGASGSLYGLMVFLIVDRLIAIQTNPRRGFFIIIQTVLLVLPHIIATIPLMIKYNVAHSAHFGGGLVGFLLGIGTLGCLWPCNDNRGLSRRICQQIAFISLIVYYIIIFSNFFLSVTPIVKSILINPHTTSFFSFLYTPSTERTKTTPAVSARVQP